MSKRPRIVCLCGSTRFMDAFHEANRRLSLAGQIVLTVEIVTYDGSTDPQRADPEQKRQLDALHLRKIDLADSVYVLNVGGYLGQSGAREVAYAGILDKHVEWLEVAGGEGVLTPESEDRLKEAFRALTGDDWRDAAAKLASCPWCGKAVGE